MTPVPSAKTSPPRLARIVPRERLFRRLDRARRHALVWIQAPPGAGKTALVASWIERRGLDAVWLTLDRSDDAASAFSLLAASASARRRGGFPPFRPEHLVDPGAYARRFFAALAASRRPPAVLVLDDYHEVRPDSLLHAALRDGLAELGGVSLVVASRGHLPPAMARLRASGAVAMVPGAELVLTPQERRAVAKARASGPVPSADALRATGGWAAGVVLLAASQGDGPEPERSGRLGVFDFMAAEVLAHADARTREVLLRTALLPTVTPEAAVALTGDPGAADVLAELARSGWFTERLSGTSAAYRYHDLFREFLLVRARQELGPRALAEHSRRAAALLASEAELDAALELLASAGAWDDLAGLLVANAPALLVAGRSESLAAWLARLPAPAFDARPWLRYFRGVARYHREPAAAAADVDGARRAFTAREEGPGAYLSWAAAVDMQAFAMEDMAPLRARLDDLDEARRRFPALPPGRVEAAVTAAAVTAYSNAKAGDPRLHEWEERAFALALSPGDRRARLNVGRQLAFHLAFWKGDAIRARVLLEALDPLANEPGADLTDAVVWHIAQGAAHNAAGDGEGARRIVERGLQLAARAGVHLWDQLLVAERGYGALEAEDFRTAEHDVAQLARAAREGPRLAQTAWHFAAAVVALRRGRFPEAVLRARTAVRLATEANHPSAVAVSRLTWAAAARFTGDGPGLVEVQREAQEVGAVHGQMGAALLEASIALARRDEDAAAVALSGVLPRLRLCGVTNLVWTTRAELAELCALALERDLEPDFVRHVVQVRRLRPGPRARTLAAWPWPVRVEALEPPARIVCGGASPGRKEQRKPLELLELLVARGERGAPVDAAADRLWPDAEGDTARHALQTTAYRLRRLLRDPAAVVQRGGRLALDPDRVFVDAWAVERLLERAEAAARAGEPGAAARLAAAARALHPGAPALEGDGADGDAADLVARRLRGLP